MEKCDWIEYKDPYIDNSAQGCGDCNFDRWGNLVLCQKCYNNKINATVTKKIAR